MRPRIDFHEGRVGDLCAMALSLEGSPGCRPVQSGVAIGKVDQRSPEIQRQELDHHRFTPSRARE
jgi:hypothetical protein